MPSKKKKKNPQLKKIFVGHSLVDINLFAKCTRVAVGHDTMQEFYNHFEGEKQKCVTYLIDSHIQLPELVYERYDAITRERIKNRLDCQSLVSTDDDNSSCLLSAYYMSFDEFTFFVSRNPYTSICMRKKE